MRSHRILVFERAVLILLAVPAGCGGRTETGGAQLPDAASPAPGEDGSSGLVPPPPLAVGDASVPIVAADAGGPPIGPDGATCAWIVLPDPGTNATCLWSGEFQGDPATCVGFPLGSGTAQQCSALCGRNASGVQADTCDVVSVSASGMGGPYGLTCRIS
jgi:hypothetical protein